VLLSSLACIKLNLSEANASNGYPVHNLNTGLHYSTIQEAVEALETIDGHKIFVKEGTYYEHVVVSESEVDWRKSVVTGTILFYCY